MPAKSKFDPGNYRIKPGAKVRLGDYAPDDDGDLSEVFARVQFNALLEQLVPMQEAFYAEGKHSLLVIFQAMDAAGKDSTIRHVFAPLNPEGLQVTSFKSPSTEELAHDFLWRIHHHVPQQGYIGVFNRSHYEDVLIARVKNLVAPERWKRRFDHCNDFEKMLADEGVVVLKFFLHISKDYQKQRLVKRLADPEKAWKFNPADLLERERWDQYMKAYEDMLSRCSTADAPWYVVPAEKRWFRDLLVARVIVERLKALDISLPKLSFDPKKIVIK
jgi:PPK2 family polyphosphate:nucleotide phosphotransferase